jgi:hypothetical protein
MSRKEVDRLRREALADLSKAGEIRNPDALPLSETVRLIEAKRQLALRGVKA